MQPFFMYLAYDTPHATIELPTQAYPAGGGLHGGLQWLGKPGQMINTAGGEIDSYYYPEYANATWDDDNNPATPEKPRLVTFGKRAKRSPWTNTRSRLARIRVSSLSRRRARRWDSRGSSVLASLQAAARPTIPGTLRVPGRSPRCWPPPLNSGARRRGGELRRTNSAPAPLGP